MRPRLVFLGTAGSVEILQQGVSAGGLLVDSSVGRLLLDPGSGSVLGLGKIKVPVDSVGFVVSLNSSEASLFASSEVIVGDFSGKFDVGRVGENVLLKLPECSVLYVVGTNDIVSADVVVLSLYDSSWVKIAKSVIKKASPRLVILSRFGVDTFSSRMYTARDLQSVCGVPVVAAQDGLVVDLLSYAAVPEQTNLMSFTKV